MATLQEKKNYISIKLDDIDKAFKSTRSPEYMKFHYWNYSEDVVVVEIMNFNKDITTRKYLDPKEAIKHIDKKLSEITNLIL